MLPRWQGGVATATVTALAIALGVSQDHLRSLHNRAENEFRLLHYPAIPALDLADGSATRIAEHTDFGTITMLFQDSVGGLQVEDQTQLGTFNNFMPNGTNTFAYNQLLFSYEGLNDSSHVFEIHNGQVGGPVSLMLFDYLTYTMCVHQDRSWVANN